jgi:manganese/zinc/iron transport system permease protein
MCGVALVLCLLTALFYKELKLLCFDQDFGRGLGFPMARLDGLLLAMIVAAVVIGLQAVGVVLISAMLILPPAAARFWTEKLNRMVPLATVLGGISGGVGAVLSALAPRMPTGPLIVLSATFIFVVSLLFAPRRGALARAWRVLATRRLIRRENALRDLYELTEASLLANGNGPTTAPLPAADLQGLMDKRGGAPKDLLSVLDGLRRQGYVEGASRESWRLTKTGLEEAYRVVRKHRLWEMFLMYETSLGAQNVDRDADEVEHFLTPEAMQTLEAMLGEHDLQPHLKPDGVLAT